ncbi:hypothetical protein HYS28_01585 [Candidatus Uhrbacteria bacterium]|nr:hypothetical protein [Candidatus Uhrbacteria bacterium]
MPWLANVVLGCLFLIGIALWLISEFERGTARDPHDMAGAERARMRSLVFVSVVLFITLAGNYLAEFMS